MRKAALFNASLFDKIKEEQVVQFLEHEFGGIERIDFTEVVPRGGWNHYVAAQKWEFVWDGELVFDVQQFHDEIIIETYYGGQNGWILQQAP